MKLLSRIGATALAASLTLQQCAAQMTAGSYTDSETGIALKTWTATSGSAFTFGMALPADALTKDATEYIGLLRCNIADPAAPGYCGISHGQSGQMTQALLLVAWASEDTVYTSFRFATGYTLPGLYTGDAKLTQISSNVTATSFEVLFRCENCFAWNQDGTEASVSTSTGNLVLGRAAAETGLEGPTCPDTATFGFHDAGFGQWGAPLEGATSDKYADWAALATTTPETTCDGSGGPVAECTAAPETTYDYIVVGAGAGGIPVADKLSQAGHKVLLIEKGPPSTGRWNGTMKPGWLDSTDLTRFDVPGLCNQIWVDSAGIACTDTDQMAGCVLGGGTAVNAGLWWKPNHKDWDENFPSGWKSTDLADATKRVFERIPGTWHPSEDGKLYRQEGFEVLSSGLAESGWKSVVPNDEPNAKNHTYGHSTFMFADGERGGPLATYLVSASGRDNFDLWTNTAVRRAVRTGGKVTGVELECLSDGGLSGTVKLNDKGGVIFASGAFGSAKLLLRSGIGPEDQLKVVASSSKDGETFTPEAEWINLPVGHNLIDHLNTDLIITHPDVVFYDFYEAWDTPNADDKTAYLEKRSGILAQAAPNIGPLMWDEVTPSDGIVRQFQWTARVEGDSSITNSSHAMTLSQYLGRGVVSRGRMTITPGLATAVTEHPYLHNDGDLEAVIQGIKNMQAALNVIPNLTWVLPPPNSTVEEYVDSIVVSASKRRANHWMGTAKLGTDDGRSGGTSVVDVNTKVYGTDNLFVVDASVFPGMSTGNPSAMIVILAEQAAQRILALRS
jgi:cellobiose dehydrogenase (acceptor)